MKHYKVIALNVGGKNNKVFNFKENVTSEDFEEGEAEQKVKEGFLEEVVGSNKKVAKAEKTEEK